MKKLKLYQCEICGTRYADKNEAKKCEKYHVKDFEVVKPNYYGMNVGVGAFPIKIRLRSKDGTEVMYRR